MNGHNRLYTMEVVIVHESDVVIAQVTTHKSLRVLRCPWVAMVAGWHVRVLSLVSITGLLLPVASLHHKAFNKTFQHCGCVTFDLSREILFKDLVDEGYNGASEALPCGDSVEVSDQIFFLDGFRCLAGHVAHVRSALKSIDGESVSLSSLDILM